jgi:hypothetical protein
MTKRFDHDAILELYPLVTHVVDINGILIAKDANNNNIDIDLELVQSRQSELELDYQRKQYQRDRKYPPIGEQLDMIWHGMNNDISKRIEPFYSVIKSVKDSYPKPNI